MTDRTDEFRRQAAEVSQMVRALVGGRFAISDVKAAELILTAMQVAHAAGRCDALEGLDVDKMFDAAFPNGVSFGR